MSETCDCACHSTSSTFRPTCTVDTGSSGVTGVLSCSPCPGERRSDQKPGLFCQVCDAKTNGYLCKPCLYQIERDLGDYRALMHEASMLATGQTLIYRAAPAGRYSDEELAELDEEYAHRIATIPARLRSRDGRMALPSTANVVNLDAQQLLADAYDTLRGQVDDLRDLANTEPDGWDDVIPWLLRNLDFVRNHPGAESVHDEITFMHGRLERAVDRSPDRIYAGPCRANVAGECCVRDLYAHPAHDEIRCDGYRSDGLGCGTEYSYSDRQEWMLKAFANAVLPLSLWRSALPKLFPEFVWPNRSTWMRWASSDHPLEREGYTETGEPTYRGGNVVDVVRERQDWIEKNLAKNKTRRKCA